MWGVKVEIVCERHKVRGTGAKILIGGWVME